MTKKAEWLHDTIYECLSDFGGEDIFSTTDEMYTRIISKIGEREKVFKKLSRIRQKPVSNSIKLRLLNEAIEYYG
jgi:CII-binding regulator of phage lambda lysogenization HflD